MLVLKIEKCLLGILRKRGRVIRQTKPSASLSEGILFLQEVFPLGEDSTIQTERWVFVTVLPLSEGPGEELPGQVIRSSNICLVKKGGAGVGGAFLETKQNKLQ